MSVFTDNDGNIYLRQGDTGQVVFTGLPTDKAYDVYLSVYNTDENRILQELIASQFTQGTGTAIFVFNEDFSNGLPVGDWGYGLKICSSNGTEDTLLPQTVIENGEIIQLNPLKFTVADKVVEGA